HNPRSASVVGQLRTLAQKAVDSLESNGVEVFVPRVPCVRSHSAVPLSAQSPFSIKAKVPRQLHEMARRAAFVVLVALVLAAPVYAWRSPSPAEHRAIVAAIRKNLAASGVRSVQRV